MCQEIFFLMTHSLWSNQIITLAKNILQRDLVF